MQVPNFEDEFFQGLEEIKSEICYTELSSGENSNDYLSPIQSSISSLSDWKNNLGFGDEEMRSVESQMAWIKNRVDDIENSYSLGYDPLGECINFLHN